MAQTFEQWKRIVDDEIARRLMGLTSDDLPDYCYRDEFDSGTSAKTTASRAIRAAKEF